MSQGPQTPKVASRVNRVQKWMNVLDAINHPPKTLYTSTILVKNSNRFRNISERT